MAVRPCFAVWFAIALLPVPLAAQDTLPWSLSQHPAGGPALSEAVATSLGRNADLTTRTCAALAAGTPEQAASGFAGIALAVFAARYQISEAIVDRFPDCCERILKDDADANISLGVAVALEARAWAESEIGLGRRIEQLVGMCSDEAFVRSYEIARGEDELGTLIAESSDEDPVSTGSIGATGTAGGGLPSPN